MKSGDEDWLELPEDPEEPWGSEDEFLAPPKFITPTKKAKRSQREVGRRLGALAKERARKRKVVEQDMCPSGVNPRTHKRQVRAAARQRKLREEKRRMSRQEFGREPRVEPEDWLFDGALAKPDRLKKDGVEWRAQPGSQSLFLRSDVFEVLLAGTRGGGKTDALIMDFLQHVGVGWGEEWRGILFRQTYPQLADIVKKTRKWIPKIFPKAQFNKNEHVWTFPKGETLSLRHMQGPDDYYNYHGHEYCWVGWEELTNWPTLEAYNLMKSCCRSSVDPDKRDKFGRPMPRKYRATTNPYGKGHNAVKKYFRLPESYGQVIREKIVTENGDEEMRPRVAIHSYFGENEALRKAEPDYLLTIRSAARNAAEEKAWLYGDWNITSGGMFDDIWEHSVHVIKPFEVPNNWRIDRAFDWGSSKPACVLWFAESDGSDVTLADGSTMSTVKGDLFIVNEWYIASKAGENAGLRRTPEEITTGIIAREIAWGYRAAHQLGDTRVHSGPADSSIWDSDRGPSIAAQMQQSVRIDGVLHKGVGWLKADKSPGSRRNGWQGMRSRLKNTFRPEGGIRELPGLFVFECCEAWIRTVPSIPRCDSDPDDVDTEVEDHAADTTRYRIMAPKRVIRSGTTN